MTGPLDNLVALDFETSGLDWYRHDFEVRSMAIAWKTTSGVLKTDFVTTYDEIKEVLQQLHGVTLLVWNASFETAILRYIFGMEFEWIDVQRLRQLRAPIDVMGFRDSSLKGATRYWLPGMSNYETEIYSWLKQKYPKLKKRELGAYLSEAPEHILENYNKQDVIATYRLYDSFCEHFNEKKFDWKPDHILYKIIVDFVVDAKKEGIKIDSEQMKQCINDIDTEIIDMDIKFTEKFADNILAVREKLRQKAQSKYKKKIVTDLPVFNTGSKDHLQMLFMGELGLQPQYKTKPSKRFPEGKPSFKSTHLGTWGEGGKILEKRGKRLIVKNQAKGLIEKAEYDGYYHPDVKVAGATRTGRLSGDGGVNVQGTQRSETTFTKGMTSKEGYILAELDLTGAEAAVLAHYSRDPRYIFANLIGKNKKPFIDDEGVLMIGDPYVLMGGVSNYHGDEVHKAWKNGINGKSFADLWLEDSEAVKSYFKKWRKIWKVLVLGMGYGLGPKSMVTQLNTLHGIKITQEQAKSEFDNYWKLFSGVKAFSDLCTKRFKRGNGRLVNDFGFVVFPKESYAAMNGIIQSIINGIMALFAGFLREKAPYLLPQAIIHDALLVAIPEDKKEDLKRCAKEAMVEVNKVLKWSVEMQSGCSFGKTYAELK